MLLLQRCRVTGQNSPHCPWFGQVDMPLQYLIKEEINMNIKNNLQRKKLNLQDRIVKYAKSNL